MLELILGAARSGKSAYAERRAAETGLPVVYIATAAALDREMAERIAHHRAHRPAAWLTIEAPLRLAEVLAEHASSERCVIVDCLTLWLSNALHAAPGEALPGAPFEAERRSLMETLPTLKGTVLLVSNEVGAGVVPFGELSRVFVDEAGHLHQRIAAIADRVVLLVAGYPMRVKG